MARRQMVSRLGRQQWPLLGSGPGDQEADAFGNLRAAVYVQSSANQSSVSTEGIGRHNDRHISPSVIRSGAGGVQKRKGWLGATARARAAASGRPAVALAR